jgi:hypothetical protein
MTPCICRVLLVAASVLWIRSAVGGDYPTQSAPWKRAGAEGLFREYQTTIAEMMALPADAVIAHPAGDDFPGAVPADAPRIPRSIPLETEIPRWHSTGLYAAPGETITVRVPEHAVGQGLQLRIGCHKDKLWAERIGIWKRVPEITRVWRLDGAMTRCANAFGGPIYIVVPRGCAMGTTVVEIEGGVAAPFFERGKTRVQEWRETLRHAPAPWAELAGHKLILSLPSDQVRRLEDPQAVVAFWDAVVAAQDELAAVTDRVSPERIVLDRQISAGYMHSGYPIMAHLDQASKVANLEALHQGNWGLFHELGHNHQRRDWTFQGTGEVTCNLFSMYTFERVCRLPMEGHRAMKHDKRAQRMSRYFDGEGTFADWTSDPFLALLTYHQLIQGFGWEPFTAVFQEYQTLSKSERPSEDSARRDQFMVRFSKQVNRNLGPFFEAWKIPTSDAARESIRHLPAWMPEGFPPGAR